MAIAKRSKDRQKNDLKKNIFSDRYLLITLSLSILFSSCGESKLTQCEQIFKIVAGVNNSIDRVGNTTSKDLNQIAIWLEAANMMNRAAENIAALHINNSELIGYQNKLATVYRIYSQATYNAVEARESKNLEALELARLEALKAGDMQQKAIEGINTYCLHQ